MERDAGAGKCRREVGELTAIERQLLDTARPDDAADDRRRGFDERIGRNDVERYRDVRDPKREIALYDAAHVDDRRLLHHRGEAVSCGAEVVHAGGEALKAVEAFGVTFVGARDAGSGFPQRDMDAVDRLPLLVDKSAPDRSGLRSRLAREQQVRCKCRHDDHTAAPARHRNPVATYSSERCFW